MSDTGEHPKRVNEILSRALRRADSAIDKSALQIWSAWDGVVGEHIAKRAQPSALRNGVLIVTVSASTWMQELQLMKERVRSQLNERVRGAGIRDICFVAGTLEEPPRVDREALNPAESALADSRPIAMPVLADGELSLAFTRIMEARERRATAIKQRRDHRPKPAR